MKKKKIYKYIFLILLLIFSILYFASSTGYYEYNNHKNVVITSEKLKEYENDIKEGKEIDYSNYITTKKTYSNKLSVFASNISNTISYITKKSIVKTFKYFEKLMEE